MSYILIIIFIVASAEFVAYLIIKNLAGGLLERKIKAFMEMPYDYHPYLSFTYKKKGYIPEDKSKALLLNREKKITTYGIPLNSLGFGDGPEGDRDVNLVKSKDIALRICCIGESTTASYINCNNAKYSYPNELEKSLTRELGEGKVEVINFGQGSWSSAEILINFILRVCDFRPDYVIMLFGYNDIPISLSRNFKSDYSHAKINIYKYHDAILKLNLRFSSKFHIKKLMALLSSRSLLNMASDIGAYLNTSKPDYDLNLDNLAVFRRNLEILVAICEARGIKPVLLTYPYYANRFNKHIKSAIIHKRALDVVNDHIRQSAKNSTGILIDAAIDFPINERNFIDSMHYSEEGTIALAELVNAKIVESLKVERTV